MLRTASILLLCLGIAGPAAAQEWAALDCKIVGDPLSARAEESKDLRANVTTLSNALRESNAKLYEDLVEPKLIEIDDDEISEKLGLVFLLIRDRCRAE